MSEDQIGLPPADAEPGAAAVPTGKLMDEEGLAFKDPAHTDLAATNPDDYQTVSKSDRAAELALAEAMNNEIKETRAEFAAIDKGTQELLAKIALARAALKKRNKKVLDDVDKMHAEIASAVETQAGIAAADLGRLSFYYGDLRSAEASIPAPPPAKEINFAAKLDYKPPSSTMRRFGAAAAAPMETEGDAAAARFGAPAPAAPAAAPPAAAVSAGMAAVLVVEENDLASFQLPTVPGDTRGGTVTIVGSARKLVPRTDFIDAIWNNASSPLAGNPRHPEHVPTLSNACHAWVKWLQENGIDATMAQVGPEMASIVRDNESTDLRDKAARFFATNGGEATTVITAM